jgi:hypothetical protein
MPLILGANSLAGGGYEIDNSLRFNDDSTDYLSKTFGSAGNQKTMTFSLWTKRSFIGSGFKTIFGCGTADGDEWIWSFRDDKLDLRWEMTNGTQGDLQTTQLFRDASAWYHIVFAIDTTQATASNRFKWYVNGTQVTSFATAEYPAQNLDNKINGTVAQDIGRFPRIDGTYDGYMSEFNFIDGQQLDPTSFGEFDEDSGIWKPIAYTGTYGTNGFYLEFKDSSALGDDTSGNSNDFTVNNLTSIDQTTDTPTNNFATLNPLGFAGTIPTFSQGNLNVVCGSGVSLYSVSTIGVSSGKWYVEGEIEQATADGGLYYIDFGFADRADSAGTSLYVTNPGRFFWHSSWDGKINYRNNGSTTTGLVTGLATFVPGDFFQLYLDMDNELMYWGKNGSLLNSTGVSFNGKESLTGEYFFAFGDQFTSGTHEYAVNFGQGSIDGVGVSAYQDVNGFGSFKYNPTVTTDEGSKDFLALCTKNLAEYG